jgi:nucleotide-binding universal stress UspA family protein
LAPVDGSAACERALDLAADLASKLGADLIVMHVLPGALHGLPNDLQDFIVRKLRQYAETDEFGAKTSETIQVERLLESAKARAAAKGIDEIEAIVRAGDTATEIVEYASAHAVDMIVLGRRGLGTLEGLFLGSVSRKILDHAPCSCVTVP